MIQCLKVHVSSLEFRSQHPCNISYMPVILLVQGGQKQEGCGSLLASIQANTTQDQDSKGEPVSKE